MTRVEVERECDKLGWTLKECVGLDVVNASGPYYEVMRDGRWIGAGNSPREAYLAACKATDTVPF